MKTYYTLGFLFDRSLEHVLLIRKNTPEWQKGKLNGVGGHVEKNESPLTCMEREFREEVDYPHPLHPPKWNQYATMKGDGFEVFCFAACGVLGSCEPKTQEKISAFLVRSLPTRKDLIENLPWLITLAIDVLQDGRPAYSYIEYP